MISYITLETNTTKISLAVFFFLKNLKSVFILCLIISLCCSLFFLHIFTNSLFKTQPTLFSLFLFSVYCSVSPLSGGLSGSNVSSSHLSSSPLCSLSAQQSTSLPRSLASSSQLSPSLLLLSCGCICNKGKSMSAVMFCGLRRDAEANSVGEFNKRSREPLFSLSVMLCWGLKLLVP